MGSKLFRISKTLTLIGFVAALIAAAAGPLAGLDGVDAKKNKKAKAPNIALQSISLEPHPDAGHLYVVVEVANVGKRDANGFRIGMTAQRTDGMVRNEEYSLPLSLEKGDSTTVQFRLGCNWINNGAVTASTDPSPVPGEPSNKIANNVLTQTFGQECTPAP